MLLALLALALITLALAMPLIARAAATLRAGHRARRAERRREAPLIYDPGRERRAEQRARELLRSCVNEEEWEMYRDLGFIRVAGRRVGSAAGGRDAGGPGGGSPTPLPYAYLIYPHKPIVAFVPGSGQLLSEYCVEFPDLLEVGNPRLPASDDVLAKWMALTSDEGRVIGRANMHLVGRQHDPARVRRDLWRLAEWERRRGRSVASAS